MYRYSSKLKAFLLISVLFIVTKYVQCDIQVSEKDLSILFNKTKEFKLIVYGEYDEDILLSFIPQHEDIISIKENDIIYINASSPPLNNSAITYYNVIIEGKSPGHSELNLNITPPNITNVDNVFLRITVLRSLSLVDISTIIGWIYFVAWSVSFYPQIYSNFRRKSVIGLNFDFLSLNIVGFVLYSIFNCGLYWIPEIKAEYSNRYPKGLNPVQLNDIVFALHATFATLLTIFQCFIYERGEQRVSFTARVIQSCFGIIILISIILSFSYVILWIDFLYICSYIKLTITLIKYMPQAYMNYKRKSTEGWSIGNILLDFTGGILSMLQMILNAYNYDDWVSIFGDPTKFGLGLFSVIFDIFFMIQHYILYRGAENKFSLTV